MQVYKKTMIIIHFFYGNFVENMMYKNNGVF